MFDRILEAICAALLAATVLIAFTAVIFRYVLGSALSWSFEASLALLTYTTFLGAYLAARKSAHLKVEVLVARLPIPAQALVFSLNQMSILAIAYVMIHYGVRQLWLFHDQRSLVIEMPLSILYAAIPLSGLLIGSQALIEWIDALRRAARREPVFQSGAAAPPIDV